MRFEDEVIIQAPAHAVWDVYADVTHWPDWTASVRSVQLEPDALAIGAVAAIDQPKLPKARWTVTALDAGRSWTWEAKAPGVHTVATHVVEPVDATTTRVRQILDQRGPLGALIGRLYAGLTRRYLAMEAQGLKASVEARANA